jgi:hypothetical protein
MEIQAEQMLYEVELLKPKTQEATHAPKEGSQTGQEMEESNQAAEKEPPDDSKGDAAKGAESCDIGHHARPHKKYGAFSRPSSSCLCCMDSHLKTI